MPGTFGALGHSAVNNSPQEMRAAAVAAADRIAAEHPHELDNVMPRLAGRQLAQDPAIAAGVRELLSVIGLLPDTGQNRGTP